ncbi:flagellar hook-associated protein FlgK [Gracilibacillus salinarum]|uniref:Flagellar hook-associated protein 1 n=1 Tax=Gracilibacillus salinarum TaxID=2932255 RepID=A0ABY4GLS8_9BACI|nr:flagellar hook-associated protein FlgK [Gracilibacillus salinarum]UOQ85169.1 flagellar hook-associated protein FlgK [Gracilibacillus salinarum]
MSTFSGLEVAKRALSTQQSALYTTGHNISNANTEGYSRQRVNMTQSSAYPSASRNRPEIPGQIGTGVEAGSIQRIRDSFIDKQFRQENTKVGYYQSRTDMMSKLETILNEPSEQGISETFDQFWESLQDLSTNPEDAGARSVVKQRALALAEVFNYTSESIEEVRTNLKNEIDVEQSEINSLVDQINDLNGQIANVEPHGLVPNDLYDKRDHLIDELSEYMDINVTYSESSGKPSDLAQGIATITVKADDEDIQNNSGQAITLVNGSGEDGVVPGSDEAVNHMHVDYDEDNNVRAVFFADPNRDSSVTEEEYVAGLTEDLFDADAANDPMFIYGKDYEVNGKFASLIEGAGYVADGEDGTAFEYTGFADGEVQTSEGIPAGEINVMLEKIDKMVVNFANEFNQVHQQGYTLDGEQADDFNFFDFKEVDGEKDYSAESIYVTEDITENTDNIAASSDGTSGNGENAINLSEVYSKLKSDYTIYDDASGYDLEANGIDDDRELSSKTSIKSFYESIIGDLGVASEEAQRMQSNTLTLKQQVQESRQSISSVSLDEEMTNMIQYQHAYNAAARNMTAVDEMLDRIINSMGLVGR